VIKPLVVETVAHERAESDQDEFAKRDESNKAQLPKEGLNMQYMVSTRYETISTTKAES
jgi:hypothetical protein